MSPRRSTTLKVANAPARRSCCPVACSLDVLGDKWTLIIVRDLFRGVSRFSEFARSPEGIATNILAARLQMLVQHGLVEQRDDPGSRRKAYVLTPLGETLEPILVAVADWGTRHIRGTEAKLAPSGTR
ncbi:MAG: helix-turn-helix domain-containing protein [Planctomycetota bacterium]